MATKIYTKTGDNGTTQFGKERVPKDDIRIEAVGALDQLNSYLGLCTFTKYEHKSKLQNTLFKIGAAVNGWGELSESVDNDVVVEMEQSIDDLTSSLPALKNFILPNNNLHYARTLARNAERRLVAVANAYPDVDYSVPIQFLNRLSDYLFMQGRAKSIAEYGREEIWKG